MTIEAEKMRRPSRIQRFATFYIQSHGYAVVPLKPRSKEPYGGNWNDSVLRHQPDDFQEHDNIGIRSIDGRVVSDADAAEAVALADAFLPATGAVWGRPSKPRSKRIYLCPGIRKTVVFQDRCESAAANKTTLLELRANHQDCAPPSIHQSGEELRWDGLLLPPAELSMETLLRAHRQLASAAMIARYYAPPGARHGWCLALAGFLRQLGLTEDEATRIVCEAGTYAGDMKSADRQSEVRSTYARPDDEPITGEKALQDVMPPNFTTSLRKFWGADQVGLSDAALETMNAVHAVVRVGSDEVILRE